MEIDYEEVVNKLNRLVELTYFICHNENDYEKNEAKIRKLIKKIENGKISDVFKEGCFDDEE